MSQSVGPASFHPFTPSSQTHCSSACPLHQAGFTGALGRGDPPLSPGQLFPLIAPGHRAGSPSITSLLRSCATSCASAQGAGGDLGAEQALTSPGAQGPSLSPSETRVRQCGWWRMALGKPRPPRAQAAQVEAWPVLRKGPLVLRFWSWTGEQALGHRADTPQESGKQPTSCRREHGPRGRSPVTPGLRWLWPHGCSPRLQAPHGRAPSCRSVGHWGTLSLCGVGREPRPARDSQGLRLRRAPNLALHSHLPTPRLPDHQ